MEPASLLLSSKDGPELNGFGGSGSGSAGSPEPDHSFVERPNIYDTWSPSRQRFWDSLVERLPKHKTPFVTLNVSQIARDFDCSRAWVQDCIDFLRRCNLLRRVTQNDRAPNEYRVNWDLREQEYPDLPFLFQGGCNKFSNFQGNAESSISDETQTESLSDSQKHRTMKYLRLQLTGQVSDISVSTFGTWLWNCDPPTWLISQVLAEMFVLNLSINERSEGGVQPYLYGLSRKWLNNVITRKRRHYRQKLEDFKKKQRRQESTSVPQSCIEKLKSNGVIEEDGTTARVA